MYCCSEVASRGPHGLECDVWSLGCMLYTLLVGHPPFDVSYSYVLVLQSRVGQCGSLTVQVLQSRVGTVCASVAVLLHCCSLSIAV